jgi:hypothetical protein
MKLVNIHSLPNDAISNFNAHERMIVINDLVLSKYLSGGTEEKLV